MSYDVEENDWINVELDEDTALNYASSGKGIQDKIIKTISFEQKSIIQNIMTLYCPEGFTLDPTYSKGNFYNDITKPKHKYDIKPQTLDSLQADCRNLEFIPDDEVKSIVYDPPFLNTQPIKETEDNDLIHKRFGFINGIDNLLQFYYDSMKEFHRILVPDGILVFKCQDMVSSGKQFLNHVEIINMAYSLGFYPIDMFVLLAKTRIISGKHLNQKHSRKYHSYFIVLQKRNSPVKYMKTWSKVGEKQNE